MQLGVDDVSEEPTDESPKVKVTDKRIFGPDGELREEYRFLGESAKRSEPEAETGEPSVAGPASGTAASAVPGAAAERGEAAGRPAEPTPLEPDRGSAGKPSFLDLLSVLAEPVAIYLGDVPLPDGRSAEDLEMARMHIDLLEVLRDSTRGNLSSQENAVLDDLLYRLRMRYVQKRG